MSSRSRCAPDGESTSTITAVGTGYQGLPADGETISIAQPSLGTISPGSATTGAGGHATFTYTAPPHAALGGRNGADVAISAEDTTHFASATASLHLKTPTPLITKIRSRYVGIFLEGVVTNNRYFVTVDWQKAGFARSSLCSTGRRKRSLRPIRWSRRTTTWVLT